jgi:ATP-binding cassette subfamily B protein
MKLLRATPSPKHPPADFPGLIRPGQRGPARSDLPVPPARGGVLGRLLAEAHPYWAHLLGVLLLGLLATPLALLTPVPLKIAIDSGLGRRPLPGLLEPLAGKGVSPLRALLLAAALQIVIVILGQLQSLALTLFSTYTGERLTLTFRARLFRHVQRLSLAYHDARGTADSIYRVQYDAPSIQDILVDGLIPFVSAALAVIGMIYITARIDEKLALVAIAVAPFLFLSVRIYRRRTRYRYKAAKGLESGALNVVQEVLTGLRVVKAFGKEDSEQQRFVDRSTAGMRARIRLALSESLFSLVVSAITAVGTSAVLVIGIQDVRSGRLTLGELMMVISYLSQLYSPIKTVSKKVASLQTSMAGAERVFELLDEMPEVVQRSWARPLKRTRGQIEFRDVSFAYEGGSPVLSGLDFTVPAGTRLAVLGRTGAGKTTLASLLTRFYDPTEGQILLDGVDIRDYVVADLRDQFAIVLQEPVLFSTTISENIAYARPDASHKEIVRAARAAGANDFVTQLPHGYETQVGERGMRLSGGERQRISLARAFLKDAPILILDEPTSSVDLGTEAAIVQAMERLMEGSTTIMITHRPSIAETCHAQLELEGGHAVVSSGALTSLARPSFPESPSGAMERVTIGWPSSGRRTGAR